MYADEGAILRKSCCTGSERGEAIRYVTNTDQALAWYERRSNRHASNAALCTLGKVSDLFCLLLQSAHRVIAVRAVLLRSRLDTSRGTMRTTSPRAVTGEVPVTRAAEHLRLLVVERCKQPG